MIKYSSQGLWLILIAVLFGGSAMIAAERSSATDLKETAAKPTAAKPTAAKPTVAKPTVAKPADPKVVDAKATTKDATFDDIKLDIKAGDKFEKKLLTEKVKKLDGKPIRIRGYILPSFKQSGIRQFVLVRDNLECCFGPKAALHDCIVVEMIGDASTSFTVTPVSVEGTFRLKEMLDPEGNTLAIYHLDGIEVK